MAGSSRPILPNAQRSLDGISFGRDQVTGEPYIAQTSGWCAPSDQLYAPKAPKLKTKFRVAELEEALRRRIAEIDALDERIVSLVNVNAKNAEDYQASLAIRAKDVSTLQGLLNQERDEVRAQRNRANDYRKMVLEGLRGNTYE